MGLAIGTPTTAKESAITDMLHPEENGPISYPAIFMALILENGVGVHESSEQIPQYRRALSYQLSEQGHLVRRD